jgi:hypothetical protein
MIMDPFEICLVDQQLIQWTLVNKVDCKINEPTLDPRWPLHDLPPQHHLALRSTVILVKFGDHRPFLHKMTTTWPVTLKFSSQWNPENKYQLCMSKHFSQIDLYMIFDLLSHNNPDNKLQTIIFYLEVWRCGMICHGTFKLQSFRTKLKSHLY